MKRLFLCILLAAAFAACLPVSVCAAENPFVDVPEDAFYYAPVMWAAESGITNGHGTPDTFRPDLNCTRAEIVTFLWRAHGSPEPTSKENQFTDVKETDYFYKAVLWAVEQGITNGHGSLDTFRPYLDCTRAEIVTFLWRSAGCPEPDTAENPFMDVDPDIWYGRAVLWAVEQGITNGYGSGDIFHPDGACTRGQIVTFLWRAMVHDINAADYGLSPDNSGEENSRILQSLVDNMSPGTIYIPAGEYLFCETGRQTIGSHCIKMKSNVSIVGAGDSTILKPVGSSREGLDMFYFNDYLDVRSPNYLENCCFENFVIDAAGTTCESYSTAGKGFMLNLFKNCHWKNVVVKNTDATGFGVDCPIDSSIENCMALKCGKAAQTDSPGASGFGIGFGYSEDECIRIVNCTAFDNKKFGFFFEHQGIFKPDMYNSKESNGFYVESCYSQSNLYNFGGISAPNVVYLRCVSECAILKDFYFENSNNCKILE